MTEQDKKDSAVEDLWFHDHRKQGFTMDWKLAKELYEKMLLLEKEEIDASK